MSIVSILFFNEKLRIFSISFFFTLIGNVPYICEKFADPITSLFLKLYVFILSFFNINQRLSIKDEKYINKITKGVYELGSIFKTFTVALALENELVDTDTIIKNIPRKIKCSIHEITDMKEHPENLSVEEILVRSSNVGSVFLAKKIGKDNYKEFIDKTLINKQSNNKFVYTFK